MSKSQHRTERSGLMVSGVFKQRYELWTSTMTKIMNASEVKCIVSEIFIEIMALSPSLHCSVKIVT